MTDSLKDPWLVAAWPGLGGVALIAAGHLVRKLGMQPVAEVGPQPWFELPGIVVREGLARAKPRPRTVIHGWRHPSGGRDLLVLVAEAQPREGAHAYCTAILDHAVRLGATRVFTFAAMATPVDPRAPARVFAAATRPGLLAELREHGAERLAEGDITGLNGAFAAEAEARGLPAACLLGEFPFFAGGIANPKASSAVLRVFAALAGLALDRAELDADAQRIERDLVAHLEQLQRAAGAQPEREGPEFPESWEEEQAAGEGEAEAATEPVRAPPEPEVPEALRERIEALFAKAREDRGQALALKAELDRLGLFKRYEDRFLDLFRQAG